MPGMSGQDGLEGQTENCLRSGGLREGIRTPNIKGYALAQDTRSGGTG